MFDSGFGGLTVARALIDLLPERGYGLRRRHGALSLRSAIVGRGSGLCPPDRRVPRRGTRCEAGHRGVQHRLGRRARRAEGDIRRAGGRRDRAGCALVGVGHPQRSRRCDRHGGHDRLRRIPASGARGPRRCEAHLCGLPRFRGVRRTGRYGQRSGPRSRRATARAVAGRGYRHSVARMHSLSLLGSDDQRCARPRGGARRLGRRDGFLGEGHARRRSSSRPLDAEVPATHRWYSSGDVDCFAGSAHSCSVPNSTWSRPSHGR